MRISKIPRLLSSSLITGIIVGTSGKIIAEYFDTNILIIGVIQFIITYFIIESIISTIDIHLRKITKDQIWLWSHEGKEWLQSEDGKKWSEKNNYRG